MMAKDMCKSEKSSVIFRYQSLIGNVIVALSLIFAIFQFKEQQEYNRNYNSFNILKEFTERQKNRQKLIVYSDWAVYFKELKAIPKKDLMDLYQESTSEKRSVILEITKLWNYYEAIDKAKGAGLISDDIYESNIKMLIDDDRKVLRNFPIVIGELYK